MKQDSLPSYESIKFNDKLPDLYLYLTINYGLTDNDMIVFLGIYLHNYIV